jgi:hypothetical protein
LTDIREVFNTLPMNFILSFTRSLQKSKRNLNSSVHRLKADISGLFFTDLIVDDKYPKTGVYLKSLPFAYLLDVKVLLSSGIPIPENVSIAPKKNI